VRIVVIGLGSMGKRRIRLIKEMYPEYEIIGIDGREDRRNETAEMLEILCFDTVSRIEGKVDCAFCIKKQKYFWTALHIVQKKEWNYN